MNSEQFFQLTDARFPLRQLAQQQKAIFVCQHTQHRGGLASRSAHLLNVEIR